MVIDNEKIGHKICEIRKLNKMTQIVFARKVHLTQQTLSRYENGKTPIPNEVIENIANEFNVPVNYFLGITIDGMTEDENRLINYYREIHPRVRESVFKIIKLMAEEFPKKN